MVYFKGKTPQDESALLCLLLHLTRTRNMTWECRYYMQPMILYANDDVSTEIVHAYDLHTVLKGQNLDLKIIERKRLPSGEHDISITYNNPWTKEYCFETVLIEDLLDEDQEGSLLKLYNSNLIVALSSSIIFQLNTSNLDVHNTETNITFARDAAICVPAYRCLLLRTSNHILQHMVLSENKTSEHLDSI